MYVPVPRIRWKSFRQVLSSSGIALISLMRGFFLLFSGRPKTPLRVLCIVAFDLRSALRSGKWLSKSELKTLAAFLDFGASANAVFDQKVGCQKELRATLQLLEEAGIGLIVQDYLQRLCNLERGRPHLGGDRSQFQKTRWYREAVVRVSLGSVATIAGDKPCLKDAIAEMRDDGELNLLFRIVMLCQIIDDVVDYPRDRIAGLPSFLTACKSLPLSRQLTQRAALEYAGVQDSKQQTADFPLRVALYFLVTCTKLIVALRRQ